MTAGIEIFANGQAGFVSARGINAWHMLGTVMPGLVSVDEAMRLARLTGWDVRKLASFAEEVRLTDTGVETIRIPGQDRYFTVRTNPVTGQPEFLGDVGSRYTVIQNEEHAEFLTTLVDISGANIETAGSLFGGKKVFISMKCPESILVGGEDATDLYIIAMNSHDGSSGFEICLSAIRPVCWNTVTAAFRGAKHRFTVRHTATATGRINDAREALQMSFKYADVFQAEAEALLAQAFTDAQFDAFLAEIFEAGDEPSTRKQNIMQDVRNLWESSPTLLSTAGTRYGAFQAFTEYQTHIAGSHGKSAEERNLARAQRDALDDKLRTQAWSYLATV
jgi:phage/plasmid-like protein (TIGR03299 family)